VRWWSPWKESTPDRPWIDDIEPPWRQAFHRLFLPDPKPGDKLPLPEDTEKSIPKNLDDKRLDSLLEQAVRISDGRRQWSTDSQARAVTMLGAVGVATGLILAGSTFLLNPDNQLAEGWRIVLSVLLGLTLVCFVISGFVATRAVTKGLIWARPQLDRVLTRAQVNDPQEARRDELLELLNNSSQNYYAAAFRSRQVVIAGEWFRAGLVLLGVLAIVLTVHNAIG
jgi:hypothetical protein